MEIKRLGMSHLAHEAGFGTRVWSNSGYWAGRFFHPLVAAGTAVILFVTSIQYKSLGFALGLLLAYSTYLFVRFYFVKGRHEASYYRPWPQLIRAQLAIATLTLIIAHLGTAGTFGNLWLLYTLQLIIVSRHQKTWVFGLSIVEVCFLLALLRWWVHPGTTWINFLANNPDLIVQWTWIALIGFVMHYLLRNIDARDENISILTRINTLADWRQQQAETRVGWEKVLASYVKLVSGKSGSVWSYSPHAGKIRELTQTGYVSEHDKVPGTFADKQIISITDDHPISHVIKSGEPMLCRPHNSLSDFLHRPGRPEHVCKLPDDVIARMLVPIGQKPLGSNSVLGVLSIDFDRSASLRKPAVDKYFDILADMAAQLFPMVQINHQVEEQQILRRIGVKVSQSLRLKTVLDDTLNALTGPLGFEFATISLVDESANLIRCEAGRNVSQDWVSLACHPLNGNDIQASVVKSDKIEVIKGWDDRFDRRIYKRFNHAKLIRAFVPIFYKHKRPELDYSVQGVVEVGYNIRTHAQITPEKLVLLEIFVDQVGIAIENARLFGTTLRHRSLLAQLHQVSYDVAGAVNLDKLFARLGKSLQEVFTADIVLLYRYNRRTGVIDPPQIFGDVWGHYPLRTPPLDNGIIAEILKTGEPYYASDAPTDDLLSNPTMASNRKKNGKRRTFTVRQNIKSFAGVPMLVKGEAVGVMCINFRRRHSFDRNEKCGLELAAQLAAVAIRNAELSASSAEIAASEERNRLFRELHDSVSQYIPAIQLMADTAIKQLDTQPEKTHHWLNRIGDAARKTMVEIRANLFEMRIASADERNLRQMLEESAGLAREHFNLEVEIFPEDIPENLGIPIETELTRICREAIINAGRHAFAQRVTVLLTKVNGSVKLQINDDGRGFDVSSLTPFGKRGLEVMRQRVEQMRGEINITSNSGEGTTIDVIVPV